MTEDDLDSIDGQLGVRMPEEYRQWARRLTTSRKSAITPFEDAATVIRETDFLKIHGFGEKRLPNDHVVVGATYTGDFFCLDLSQDPAPVMGFDHERQRLRIVSFSFTSWLKRLSKEAT